MLNAREILLAEALEEALKLLKKRYTKGYPAYDALVKTAWALGVVEKGGQNGEGVRNQDDHLPHGEDARRYQRVGAAKEQ